MKHPVDSNINEATVIDTTNKKAIGLQKTCVGIDALGEEVGEREGIRAHVWLAEARANNSIGIDS